MRPRADAQATDDLRHAEVRIRAQHQADCAGNDRRREAAAEHAAVGRRARRRRAAVVENQETVVAEQRAPCAIAAVVAADGCERDLRSEVRVRRLEAVAIQGGDRDDAAAIGRPRDAAMLVARRRDDDHALRSQVIDRRLVGRVAGRVAAEADVDDACRVRIDRHARHRQARGPVHAVDDVGDFRAALAGHPHRQHAAVPIDAGHAECVVGDRGDDAGDVGAVP